jgi:hypothetical protein
MQANIRKALHEFDLRLTEVCAATHIESALEKQREILRLIDTFSGIIQQKEQSDEIIGQIQQMIRMITRRLRKKIPH